jgi:hypothetical protein
MNFVWTLITAPFILKYNVWFDLRLSKSHFYRHFLLYSIYIICGNKK